MYQQQRINPLLASAVDNRAGLQAGQQKEHSVVCSPSCRNQQFLGRCPVQADRIKCGMGPEPDTVRTISGEVRRTSSGPLCLSNKPSSGELHLQDGGDSNRRTRSTEGSLDNMDIDLPVPSPTNHTNDTGGEAFEGFHWPSVVDSPSVESPTVVPRTISVVSSTPEAHGGCAAGHNRPGLHNITQLTRMEFLRRTLRRTLSPEIVDDITASHRTSTVRQYQSAWKKFQTFIEITKIKTISSDIFLEFASYLFHKLKLSIPTVSCHISAISDPLKFAYNISASTRFMELLKSSFFIQRPPKRKSAPAWSLRAVLNNLASGTYVAEPSHDQLMSKAIFLIALASGYRISELAALMRTNTLTKFAPDSSFVLLATNPKFIAKNERLTHRLKPIKIPALMEGNNHHALCPVIALKDYIHAVPADASDRLWVWPTSNMQCTPNNIAKVICAVIKEADPTSAPKAHDVRSCASSVAFARSLDALEVAAAGQWASCKTFIESYLNTQVEDGHCVALGSTPQRSLR